MATQATGAVAPSSVDALRRVKAVETDWEARLKAAREESEATLRRLREESEAAVKAVHAQMEHERAERVEHARLEATGMAAAILADGEKAAEAAARGEGKRPADKKDAILGAVLGKFVKD
jgi:vacuolar-type H+-ATPase subunit H